MSDTATNQAVEQVQQIPDRTINKLIGVHIELMNDLEELKSSLMDAIFLQDLTRIFSALDSLETNLIDTLRTFDIVEKYPDVANTLQAEGLELLEAFRKSVKDIKDTLLMVDELDDSPFLVENPNIFQAFKNNRVAKKFKQLKARVAELLQYVEGGYIPGFVQISGDIYPTMHPEKGILSRINEQKPSEA
jgi:uncharacterized protein YjgD (DUF1641 family)